MGKIKNLQKEYLKDNKFLELFINRKVKIYENIQGYRFSVENNNGKLLFYNKYDRYPLDIIDRTLFRYLEYPINYFKSFDINKFPENYRFNFEYFFNNSPGIITYSSIPKSKLILTYICIKNSSNKTVKIINDTETIRKWSQIFNTSYISPLFDGSLDSMHLKKLNNYLKFPENYSSFTKFIFQDLLKTSKFPMLQNNYVDFIDGIIFEFDKDLVLKLSDPRYVKNKEIKQKERNSFSNDSYSLFIIDFMNYIENNGFPGDLESTKIDYKYVELICNIFNNYIENKKEDVINIDFFNKDFLKNEKTLELIKDKKLEITLQIVLSTFRKYKSKEDYIFTKNILTDFNLLVDKINNFITEKESDFLSFSDFLKK
jgi:hypothetical protein